MTSNFLFRFRFDLGSSEFWLFSFLFGELTFKIIKKIQEIHCLRFSFIEKTSVSVDPFCNVNHEFFEFFLIISLKYFKLQFFFDFLGFFNWFILWTLINYDFENFFCRCKPFLVLCEVIKDVFNCLSSLRS